MSRFGRLLIVLLLAAIPLQGAAAASRWLCVAGSQESMAANVAHSHEAHEHGDSTPGSHVHSAVAPSSMTVGGPHMDGGGWAHGASATCSLCAACCLTVAAPPARLEPPAVASTSAGFPPLTLAVADFLARGLERPPRLA